MNKVERLSHLMGSKSRLAAVCEVSNAMVTRWAKEGAVPVKYNPRLKAYIAGLDAVGPGWKRAALECLEEDVCPTCGQPLHGRVI